MLKKSKQKVLELMRGIGLLKRLLNSTWRSNQLLILGYHGLSLDDEHAWNPELYLPPRTFQSRMQLIYDLGCSVLPLSDAVIRLQNGTLPKKSVVITVDDGFYDFYARAYPILKYFQFPATVYQTTYYCNREKPVFDVAISYLLWKGSNVSLDAEEFSGNSGVVELRDHNARSDLVIKILNYSAAQEFSADEKDNLVESLAQRLGLDYQAFLKSRVLQLMNTEELREISASGIDVQLHTHRHRTPDDRLLFMREIEDNRRFLKAISPTSASHFCYPSGIYESKFLPWLELLGVKSATTCDVALATASVDPLLLPRYMDTSLSSDVEFEGWLSGFSCFIPTRRRLKSVLGNS
jgi:peptidoglycan/xylan/chitin deacetylase (PgdA/CDA1 family)